MADSIAWRRSQRSQNGHNCVEVRNTLDQVRDSKNASGTTLRVDVPALVNAVRSGHLDR